MKILNRSGEPVECFLEIVIERQDGTVIMSDVREPTLKEVEEIKSEPCDHWHQKLQLVHDERGPIYDSRSCALCGCDLGTV